MVCSECVCSVYAVTVCGVSVCACCVCVCRVCVLVAFPANAAAWSIFLANDLVSVRNVR